MVYVEHAHQTQSDSSHSSSTPGSIDSENQSNVSNDPAKQCRPFLSAMVRAIKAWSAEHVPLSSPFLVCQFIGPYACMTEASNSVADNQRTTTDRDLTELTMSRYAKFWPLGSLVLGEITESDHDTMR